MSKKILITGAQGQLGQALLHAGSVHERFALNKAELDISDPLSIRQALDNYCPDLIINAAAYTAVDKAETDEYQARLINTTALGYLAQAAKKINIPLLHISTDYVFNGLSTIPYSEIDSPNPQSVYGKSKLTGELLLQDTHEKHWILRTSWVFSAKGHNFVKTMCRLMKERVSLNIVADQWGCPTSAEALAQACLKIIDHYSEGKSHFGLYHYCGSPATTWFDFAICILAELKKYHPGLACQLHPISTAEYPTAAKRPAYSVLNTEKIMKTFGIVADDWKKSLEEIMQELS